MLTGGQTHRATEGSSEPHPWLVSWTKSPVPASTPPSRVQLAHFNWYGFLEILSLLIVFQQNRSVTIFTEKYHTKFWEQIIRGKSTEEKKLFWTCSLMLVGVFFPPCWDFCFRVNLPQFNGVSWRLNLYEAFCMNDISKCGELKNKGLVFLLNHDTLYEIVTFKTCESLIHDCKQR